MPVRNVEYPAGLIYSPEPIPPSDLDMFLRNARTISVNNPTDWNKISPPDDGLVIDSFLGPIDAVDTVVDRLRDANIDQIYLIECSASADEVPEYGYRRIALIYIRPELYIHPPKLSLGQSATVLAHRIRDHIIDLEHDIAMEALFFVADGKHRQPMPTYYPGSTLDFGKMAWGTVMRVRYDTDPDQLPQPKNIFSWFVLGKFKKRSGHICRTIYYVGNHFYENLELRELDGLDLVEMFTAYRMVSIENLSDGLNNLPQLSKLHGTEGIEEKIHIRPMELDILRGGLGYPRRT